MQKQNILCNRLGIVLAALVTAFALTPGLAQSGTLEKSNLSSTGGDAGASPDPLVTVAGSAAGNLEVIIIRTSAAIGHSDRILQWVTSEDIEPVNDESRDLAQNIIRNVNPGWNRIAGVNRASLFPGWARPGWGALRPWDQGWYDRRYFTSWSWWGARSRAWRTTSLASRVSINKAVDNAINNYIPYIVVPKTNYKLLYGTELPSGGESVSFVVQANSTDYQLNANCKQGTLNGQEPSNIEEAELLNAACQVAYGSV